MDIVAADRWKSADLPSQYARPELAERDAIDRFKDGRQTKGGSYD